MKLDETDCVLITPRFVKAEVTILTQISTNDQLGVLNYVFNAHLALMFGDSECTCHFVTCVHS